MDWRLSRNVTRVHTEWKEGLMDLWTHAYSILETLLCPWLLYSLRGGRCWFPRTFKRALKGWPYANPFHATIASRAFRWFFSIPPSSAILTAFKCHVQKETCTLPRLQRTSARFSKNATEPTNNARNVATPHSPAYCPVNVGIRPNTGKNIGGILYNIIPISRFKVCGLDFFPFPDPHTTRLLRGPIVFSLFCHRHRCGAPSGTCAVLLLFYFNIFFLFEKRIVYNRQYFLFGINGK